MLNATTVHIRFSASEGFAPGKVADAELTFSGGLLDGLLLRGFGVWFRHGSYAVTYPAVRWGTGPGHQAMALLRPDPAQGLAGERGSAALEEFIVRHCRLWLRQQQRQQAVRS